MADFNIRTDAVDVEQIMRQIRTRIESKRGVDYTEQQIQELASVKLERFLDPKGVRSDLVEQFRRVRDTKLEAFQLDEELRTGFDAEMLYGTHRGILRTIRRLLNPLLKLFFNPNPMISALSTQARLNKAAVHREAERDRRQTEWNALHYEIVQRLVLEISRTSLEAQQLSMRVEALSAKVEFAERRARSIEVALHQTRPVSRQEERVAPMPQPAPQPREVGTAEVTSPPAAPEGGLGEGSRRRRRRRRGRKPQGFTPEGAVIGAVAGAALPVAALEAGAESADVDEPDDDDGGPVVGDADVGVADVGGADVGDADVAGDEGDGAFPEPLPIVKAVAPPVPDEPAPPPPPDVAVAATPPAAEATTTTQPESVEADLPDRPERPDPFGD